MAKRKKDVYIKGQYGVNEFIYVDLLPEVKRIRQFNGQVIVVLLLFVISTFIFIFLPYNRLVMDFEESNGINRDLKHEYTLTQEEYQGYEIDTNTIRFSEDIDTLEGFMIDYPGILGDLTLVVMQYNADFVDFSFSLMEEELAIKVSMMSVYQFEELNSQLRRIPWVVSSSYSTPQRAGNDNIYHSTFTLGVDFFVE